MNFTVTLPFPAYEPADADDLAAANAGLDGDLLRPILDQLELAGVAVDEDAPARDRQPRAGDLEEVGEAELPVRRLARRVGMLRVFLTEAVTAKAGGSADPPIASTLSSSHSEAGHLVGVVDRRTRRCGGRAPRSGTTAARAATA